MLTAFLLWFYFFVVVCFFNVPCSLLLAQFLGSMFLKKKMQWMDNELRNLGDTNPLNFLWEKEEESAFGPAGAQQRQQRRGGDATVAFLALRDQRAPHVHSHNPPKMGMVPNNYVLKLICLPPCTLTSKCCINFQRRTPNSHHFQQETVIPATPTAVEYRLGSLPPVP